MAKRHCPKKTYSHEQRLAFVYAANPHQWYYTAANLHAQAIALRGNQGRSLTTFTSLDQVPVAWQTSVTWDDTNRVTFLLAAFAMENMLKAFLVYDDPSLIAEGYLNKKIKTHDLSQLAENASRVPYRIRDQWVFEALSEGNESWARYPCGRSADDIQLEGQFTEKLWDKYCAMMHSYGSEIRRLLSIGWEGPCEFYGRWEFAGEF